jgi:probable F420-dependent oxidoreductase
MPKLPLGPLGVTLGRWDWSSSLDAAAELDELGYTSIWLSGGQLDRLGQMRELVRAAPRALVGNAIIAVDKFPAADVATAYAEIEADRPGRFVVGIGGAHGARPLRTLGAYFDALDGATQVVPAERRVLAALGPRMLTLARERAAGALPIVVPPSYTKEARAILGTDTSLIVQQCVVLDTDAERAREAGRGTVGFLRGVPGYVAHFRRLGFTEEEIAGLADRLVDALVAWGDVDAVTAHVRSHLDAGADQVAVTVLDTGNGKSVPIETWRELAGQLRA